MWCLLDSEVDRSGRRETHINGDDLIPIADLLSNVKRRYEDHRVAWQMSVPSIQHFWTPLRVGFPMVELGPNLKGANS